MLTAKDPILPEVLSAAKEFATRIPQKLPEGDIDRIYLHWSALAWDCDSEEYNVVVTLRNNQWCFNIDNNFQDNAYSTYSDANYAQHTWHRNTGALGVCVDGMDGNSIDVDNFGLHPVQQHELEMMCAGVAVLCKMYKIDPLGKVTNDKNHLDNANNVIHTLGEWLILTHAEVAVIDGYQTERWDLGILVPLPSGVDLTPAMRSANGNLLRERINAYLVALNG